jgi:tRNA-dihydrouridine synthase B
MNKDFFKEKIKIGKLSIPRFMAAPMDGVIDYPMRCMIRKFSKDELLFTQMRHVSFVANEKSGKSVKFEKIEQPLAYQVSASTEKFLTAAAQKVAAAGFVMLNLNAGCPAKNVFKSGAGVALMEKPELLEKIIKTLKKETEDKIPFTLKIRAGVKKNAFEIASMAQDCGVDMIIIHPRTRSEGFSDGTLDFELVKKIKQALKIPLIFSGNIDNFETVKRTYEKTGVDGFMVGRALWGAPWKLHQIKEQIDGKDFKSSLPEIIDIMIEHFDRCVKCYDHRGHQIFKAHIAQYLRGFDGASNARCSLLRINSADDLREQISLCGKDIETA